MPRRALCLVWLAWGCSGPEEQPATKDAVEVIDDEDLDGDGFKAPIDGGQDCDDEDDSIHPGAIELCDGIDQDCDEVADNGAMQVVYEDLDGDGRGTDESEYQGCDPPEGWVESGGDCDDANATRYPGAPELCNGIDDDCDEESIEAAIIGTESYNSVGDAVAASQPGDLIELCDGVFPLSAQRVEHPLTIASLSGDPALATLEGDGNNSLFIGLAPLTLQGLTLRGGGGSENAAIYSGVPVGGAINAIQSDVTVENCIFEENNAAIGGAVAALQLTATDTIFRNNNALGEGSAGGAVFAPTGGAITATGSTFEDNTAEFGAGVFALGFITLTSSTVSFNVAAQTGGGVYAGGGACNLVDTDILSNGANAGGGLFSFGISVTADADTLVANNTAALIGGGAWLYGMADMSWSGGTVQGNTADQGAGFYADRVQPAYYGYAGGINITDVLLQGNLAQVNPTSAGGGLYLAGSPIEVVDSELIGNTAAQGGGAVITSTTNATMLQRVAFQDNVASQGGGLAMLSSEVAMVQGEFLRNVADQNGGGGIFLGHPGGIDLFNVVFGDEADENLTEDVYSNNGTAEAGFDLDGTIQTKCISIIPACP